MNRTLTFLSILCFATASAMVLGVVSDARSDDKPADDAKALLAELKTYRHQLVYETNRDGNWELYLCNADGSDPVNLTHTPDIDELYPKPSPDGSKICFIADEGKGDAKVRNIYYMTTDGTGRVQVDENG